MTKAEIHNVYLHISGKAEGIVAAGGKADFPVMFANAIIDLTKKQKKKWVGLTRQERSELWFNTDMSGMPEHDYGKAVEAKLKEKNT